MIPIAKPYIDENEINAVVEVLKSGVLSLGPKLVEFEQNFAQFMGMKYAIAVSSGTAGLHLGIKSLGIHEKDEVITSPFSFISSANSILFENAKPVFVDIDEDTLNIDPKKIEAAITPQTKAILPVHIFGQSCDMDLIMGIAKKYNLKILEDACESVGAKYKNKLVGTKGDLSVFAFYPNKQMTTGEGGMIITDNEEIYKTCASLRNQGRDSMSWLGHNRLGYNYRLNELSCALGIEQLKKLPMILSKRQKVAERYNQNLKHFPEIRLPYISPDNIPSWFVYVIRLNNGLNRNLVMEKLKEVGVSSKEYLPSIHLQPFYKDKYGFKEGDFPISEKVSNCTIALPFYTSMTFEDIDYVCEKLKEVIQVIKNESR